MGDNIEDVARSMGIVFEGLREVQTYEDLIAKRKAARSVELLRRKGVRMYKEIDLDAQRTARISAADTPDIIDYSVFEPYLKQKRLPALTSTDPNVLRARECVGKELYYLVAGASKIIAEQSAIRFRNED